MDEPADRLLGRVDVHGPVGLLPRVGRLLRGEDRAQGNDAENTLMKSHDNFCGRSSDRLESRVL